MSDDTETPWQVVGHEGCESEPIHTPNAIQARGWLLAFDRVQGRVTHVSSNLAVAAAEMLNTPSVLGAALEDVVRGLELPAAAAQLGDIDEWHTTMPWLTADAVMLTAHSTDDHYVIEIECDVASVAADSTEMIARLLAAPNWQAFADETVAALSQTFGYARTMAYTFHADHHGEVTAEHLVEPSWEPFVGLHYPAADIPQQARALYVRQLVRVIDDVNGPMVDLLGTPPDDTSARALDLTYANRRAVSPVHLEYMRNMMVSATATISVVQQGRLTGMFVMHHTEPRPLSLSDRRALATVSRIASYVATTMDEKAFATRRAHLATLADELRRQLSAGVDAISGFDGIGDRALTAVGADGLVFRLGGEVLRLGDVPEQHAVDRWVRQFGSERTDSVEVTDRLVNDMPEVAGSTTCAGAIAARLTGSADTYLAWFRRPFLGTVRWGGQPTGTVRQDERGRLHPRGSFDEFVENVTDRSRTWSDHDRIAADTLHHAVQSGMAEWVYRQLAVQATIDPLTGLGNRRSLTEAIEAEMRFRSAVRRFAVLFIDLDRFKQINDAFGHHKGDLVLQATADRLERVTFYLAGRAGSVFRLGGDEFVVLVRDAAAELVSSLADGILAAFREPVVVDGATNVVNVSIGAVADADGAADAADAAEVLRRGDLAMYAAKGAGGSRVAFYKSGLSHQAVRRSTLEQQLYRALDGDELQPAFQPIVSLRTGQIVGTEALARWRHPAGGVLLPAEFIPLAEETGQIGRLDRLIAERAVTECLDLLRDPAREFHLAVNASAKTLDADYVDFVSSLVSGQEIPPERLTIELTESAMIQESGRLRSMLGRLRAVGVKVAIDDFGTGYSSLAYLQNLPVDVVKLDRAFIEPIGAGTDGAVVARWAISLVAELGMRIIAEGVETGEQEQSLISHGYDWVQGHRYGMPMLARPPSGPSTIVRR